MNVYDSERMADILTPHGYSLSDRADDADLVILNTCHIREKAAEKVYSELGRMRRAQQTRRDHGADMTIAVAGCVAQAEGDEIIRRAPVVDMVFGPQTYHRLPEMLARLDRDGARRKIVETDFPVEEKFDTLSSAGSHAGVTAFLTVQEGCDKFCTYCVVPYTRGAEFSRPVADVLAEARRLAAAGVREITLLGQNVNAYHGEAGDGGNWTLGRLIREIAEISGIARIRYTTSYPSEMDHDLISAHAEVPQLMPYLHLPVQSGSDRVLEAMNRRHSAAEYLALVDKIRTARPDIALSSDFIVGFPGENRRDFEATLKLVEQVGFAQAYSFKYSARPGTPAAAMPYQIEEAEKSHRLAVLQQLLTEQQRAFNAACVGKDFDILFEKPGRAANQIVGRSPYLQPVHIEGTAELIGDITKVRITAHGANSLSGRPADRAAPAHDVAIRAGTPA